MATPDKRYHCSDLVPGDSNVNACQQFSNHCGNKGSIYWIAIFSFLRYYISTGRFDERDQELFRIGRFTRLKVYTKRTQSFKRQ